MFRLLALFLFSLLFSVFGYAKEETCSQTQTKSTSNSDETKPEIEDDDQPCAQQSSNDFEDGTIPVQIEADHLKATGRNEAIYTGDVIVTRGKRTLNADQIILNQEKNSINAEGNVVLNDGELTTKSSSVNSDLQGERVELYDTNYKFACQGFRGDAAYVLKDGKAIYTMEDGSLTTCPDGNKSWRIKASEIEVDNEKEEATFHDTRFEILDVPVFYWPYVTVPIGDKRKTGFLFPSAGYDTENGVEINIPIYFNLAENYDLTTTINYMEKRGIQLDNQFRYLTREFGTSVVDFEYLHSDQQNKDEGARWGLNWQHQGVYKRNWLFEIDYAQVSDIYYFDDFDSDIGEREDSQLNQTGEVSYRTEYTDTKLVVRDFQELTAATPYRLMPQLSFSYNRPNVYDELGVTFDSHISQLTTDNDALPDATRVHVEPGLKLPLHAPWGQLTSEAKLMYTYYDQDLKEGQVSAYNPELEETADRTIPKLRINGSLYFDSQESFIDGYTQTLEPRMQYLYVPEVDQSEIYSGYDSTIMQQDYYGLFRDRQYTSVDYIAPANQVSYGLTSRFYDEDYNERFNLSFGQIVYLHDTENRQDSLSAWALENEVKFNDQWQFKGGLQYNSGFTDVQQAFGTVEYTIEEGGYVQLDYRYTAKDYIQLNAPGISQSQLDSYTREGISQAGVLTQFDLTDNVNMRANYYHDMTEDNMLESMVGLTYNDDCWYFGVTVSRRMAPIDNVATTYPEPGPDYETNVSFSVGLKGLGSQTGTSYADDSNSLGYARPFSLN